MCSPANYPKMPTVGSGTWSVARGWPKKGGFMGWSIGTVVRADLGVIDVCGHAGGVGLVVCGL